jgi:hypothetical protein
MPYALIPDGYSLKKVTKLQKQAVNEKRRHDDVVALLNNENTPLVIGGVLAGLFASKLASSIISDLQEEGVQLTESVQEKIKASASNLEAAYLLNPLTGPLVLSARALEGFKLPSAKDIEQRLKDFKFGGLA